MNQGIRVTRIGRFICEVGFIMRVVLNENFNIGPSFFKEKG